MLQMLEKLSKIYKTKYSKQIIEKMIFKDKLITQLQE